MFSGVFVNNVWVFLGLRICDKIQFFFSVLSCNELGWSPVFRNKPITMSCDVVMNWGNYFYVAAIYYAGFANRYLDTENSWSVVKHLNTEARRKHLPTRSNRAGQPAKINHGLKTARSGAARLYSNLTVWKVAHLTGLRWLQNLSVNMTTRKRNCQ